MSIKRTQYIIVYNSIITIMRSQKHKIILLELQMINMYHIIFFNNKNKKIFEVMLIQIIL